MRVSDARGAGGPTHAYRLTVRPPRPDFTVSFNPTAPTVWKGGAVPVTVTATRLDGFDGPIDVRLDGLPARFHAPATLIEAGQHTTAFALFAGTGAAVPAEAAAAQAGRRGPRSTARRSSARPPARRRRWSEPGDLVTTTNAVGAGRSARGRRPSCW